MAIYTGLALFAGGGGLELGLSLALGSDYKAVAYVERECTSAAVLAANMERGWLDKAPVWDDVTTFTGDAVSPLVDNIDIVTAGFPCQPWSVAGSRKGTDDERWLWPLIFRLVREIRPRSIFLENVPGLLHGGIEHVLGDLASVGFDAEWTSIRASDVGAPHRRERVFILANSSNLSGQVPPTGRADGTSGAVAAWASGELGITSSSGRSTGRHREREHQVRDNGNGSPTEDIEQRGIGQSGTSEGSEALGYASGTRPQEREVHAGQVVGEGSTDMGNTDGERRWQQGNSEQQPAGIDWGSRPFYWPPSPTSPEWGEIQERYPELAPAKPEVRNLVDGTPRELARSDKLRILGNGVVPQQAALAYSVLAERLQTQKAPG